MILNIATIIIWIGVVLFNVLENNDVKTLKTIMIIEAIVIILEVISNMLYKAGF